MNAATTEINYEKGAENINVENINTEANITDVVFILDRSGSMAGLESDTIGGYNSFLEKQRDSGAGKAYVTTVLFDTEYEVIHNGINIDKVAPLTNKEYFARGGTALLDAVGKTINETVLRQHYMDEKERPSKTIFVIITDGAENSSREFSYRDVTRLIEAQKEKEKWEFLFLGANIDAAEAAERIGISRDRAARYAADRQGTAMNFYAMDRVVSNVRESSSLDICCCLNSREWAEDIDEYYEETEGKSGKGKNGKFQKSI